MFSYTELKGEINGPNLVVRQFEEEEAMPASLTAKEDPTHYEGAETKRRRRQDQDVPPGFVNESTEEPWEGQALSEKAKLVDFQIGTTAANASTGQMIEPTLMIIEAHVPPSCRLDEGHSQQVFGTSVMGYYSIITGLVSFLHALHKYPIVAGDPSAMRAAWTAIVQAVELLLEPSVQKKDSSYLVGLNNSRQVTSRTSTMTSPFLEGSQGYVAAWTGHKLSTGEQWQMSKHMVPALQLSRHPRFGSGKGGFAENATPKFGGTWRGEAASFPCGHQHSDTGGLDEIGKEKGVLFEDDSDGYGLNEGAQFLLQSEAVFNPSVITIKGSRSEGSSKRPRGVPQATSNNPSFLHNNVKAS